jgi:hypothetical protein
MVLSNFEHHTGHPQAIHKKQLATRVESCRSFPPKGSDCALLRTHRAGFHPCLDERAQFLLRARRRLAAESGRPGPADQRIRGHVRQSCSGDRPPLRAGSLICTQISPTVLPCQAISLGARCHCGRPGTPAGSKLAPWWHVAQRIVTAPKPSRPRSTGGLVQPARKLTR